MRQTIWRQMVLRQTVCRILVCRRFDKNRFTHELLGLLLRKWPEKTVLLILKYKQYLHLRGYALILQIE
jgi:hypothetical protein